MTDDGKAVAGETNVKLESVAAVLERQVEGFDGIFGNAFSSAGSAMTEE